MKNVETVGVEAEIRIRHPLINTSSVTLVYLLSGATDHRYNNWFLQKIPEPEISIDDKFGDAGTSMQSNRSRLQITLPQNGRISIQKLADIGNFRLSHVTRMNSNRMPK